MNLRPFIPNFLTSANLFCGMLALVFVGTDQLIPTAFVLVLALIFDFFDGFAARILKVSSPMGKELDSLADMLTFGAVPGFIMAKLIQDTQALAFLPQQLIGESGTFPFWLFGFVVSVFSALRLAKFNIDERQSDAFYGLPTPANAILIFSFWLIVELSPESWMAYPFQHLYTLIILCLISSYLLIADIRLISLKFKNMSWSENVFRYLLIMSALLLFAFFQYKGIPLIIFIYILLSIVENLQKN